MSAVSAPVTRSVSETHCTPSVSPRAVRQTRSSAAESWPAATHAMALIAPIDTPSTTDGTSFTVSSTRNTPTSYAPERAAAREHERDAPERQAVRQSRRVGIGHAGDESSEAAA
jgi:hypothetical protein